MSAFLHTAIRAAREAGNVILRGYEDISKLHIEEKTPNDYVSEVDRKAEEVIISVIQKAYPDHSIISEEAGIINGAKKDFQWIIDPLDGTNNFVKHFPHFAVSIALRVKGSTEIAVVFDPLKNEIFTAIKGQGAKLNSSRLRVNPNKTLATSILATGFPFKNKSNMPIQMSIMTALSKICVDFRRTGSAALDLCYCASSRIDGFFEMSLRPWDIAAGELIAREAGLLVSDFNGGFDYLTSGNVVAAPSKVLREILKEISSRI
ncbi:MAG: inositol-1-monophosphatase [Psittacicella sp.]